MITDVDNFVKNEIGQSEVYAKQLVDNGGNAFADYVNVADDLDSFVDTCFREFPSNRKYSYCYYDLNRDGIKELLIYCKCILTDIRYNFTQVTDTLFDIWTIKDNKPYHVINSVEPIPISICENGIIKMAPEYLTTCFNINDFKDYFDVSNGIGWYDLRNDPTDISLHDQPCTKEEYNLIHLKLLKSIQIQ